MPQVLMNLDQFSRG